MSDPEDNSADTSGGPVGPGRPDSPGRDRDRDETRDGTGDGTGDDGRVAADRDAGDGKPCDGDTTGDETDRDGPVRRCAVSRREHPVGELIRFVAAPDGQLLADIGRKLPGRGVWVEARRSAVEEAVRRNVFAKSLKRKVTIEAGLPDRIERQLVRRLIDALALANKAGLVVTGAEKVSRALEKGNVRALLHGQEAARDGVAKLDRKLMAVLPRGREADFADVILLELAIDEISLAIGRPNVVHAALRSGGATERLLETALRLRRFRGSGDVPL